MNHVTHLLKGHKLYQPAVDLCPQSEMCIHLKHLLYLTINSLFHTIMRVPWGHGLHLFELCIPQAKKCLLNACWSNTNVDEIWMAQYKPTIINWEGAPNS